MNSKRLVQILLLTILLIGLSIYGKISNPEIILSTCLTNPEQHDGAIITVGTEATVAEMLPNGFLLQQRDQRIPVYGNVPEIAKNEFVNIVARFHKEGYLELQKLYVAKGRRFKIAASVLPVLLIVFFFIKSYRFDPHRFLFYKRDECRT